MLTILNKVRSIEMREQDHFVKRACLERIRRATARAKTVQVGKVRKVAGKDPQDVNVAVRAIQDY